MTRNSNLEENEEIKIDLEDRSNEKSSVEQHSTKEAEDTSSEDEVSESELFKEIDDIEIKRIEDLPDNEAIIELDKLTGKNDSIIERDYLSSLVEQEDRVVYYSIENIYHKKSNRTFKNRMKLRKDPPVLIVKDDLGNEAIFYLTENLTDELSETLRQVKRAYYGFSSPTDINIPDNFLDRIKYFIKKNPFKILSTIFLILFIMSLSMNK